MRTVTLLVVIAATTFGATARAATVVPGQGIVMVNHGQGYQQVQRKLKINIPAGVDDGTRLRLAQEGQPGGNGGPNGDLFVEGTKVVMINHEEYHLYVSGLIRSADIARDNSVPSSRIADAQVEFSGRGDVDDTTEKGWLAKILDTVNPF